MGNIDVKNEIVSCIRVALLQLLGVKPIEKISISEICKRAGVSRNTFYRHYSSKDELVKDLYETTLSVAMKMVDEAYCEEDKRAWLLEVFESFKSNIYVVKAYLESGLYKGGYAMDSEYAPEDSFRRYKYIAREGAFMNILMEWIDSGLKESPEEMAQISARILWNDRY